jgi:rRNA maturation endonuclease Nob1
MFAYLMSPFEVVVLIRSAINLGLWLLVVVTCIVVLKNQRNWGGGALLPAGLRCPQCHEAVPQRARFCPSCGNRLKA